jgi:hypothetical protein
MNPFFNQIRKYTLRQIMNLPLLPKPKTPLPLLKNSKDSVKLLQKTKLKEPSILCEKCKKNAVKQAIEESIKFR